MFRFDAKKTHDTILRILVLQRPGKFIAINKMLYLLDRRALRKWERLITGDKYYMTDDGPIPAASHYLLQKFIMPRFLRLDKMPEFPNLNEAEMELIDDLYLEKSHFSDIFRELSEIQVLGDCEIMTEISHRDMLRAVGKTEEDIERIAGKMAEIYELERVACS